MPKTPGATGDRTKNPLYTFLTTKGWWWKEGSGASTHTFFDGGKAVVRGDSSLREFWRAYGDAVDAGHAQYACERTGDGRFRMFMDLDVKGCGPEDDERMCAIVRCVLRALPAALRKGSVVVCLRRPLPDEVQKQQQQQQQKHGAHLTWTDVEAPSPAAAMEWRGACVRDADMFSLLSGMSLPTGATWSGVIDEAVYKRSGLRMVYSRKKGGESYYVPAFVADPRTGAMRAIEDCECSTEEWVERCSLHWEPPVVSAPLEAPRERLVVTEQVPAEQVPATSSRRAVDGCDVIRRLRTLLPSCYSWCNMSIVERGSKDGGGDTTMLVKLDSKYCHLAGREHKGNHVFLVVGAFLGVQQRCHCRCPGTRCAAAAGSRDVAERGHPLLPAASIGFMFGDVDEPRKPRKPPNKKANVAPHRASSSSAADRIAAAISRSKR